MIASALFIFVVLAAMRTPVSQVLIPALNQIIDRSMALGVDSFVLGMPHRGRLNVLANVAETPLERIFCRFNPTLEPSDEVGGEGGVCGIMQCDVDVVNRSSVQEVVHGDAAPPLPSSGQW